MANDKDTTSNSGNVELGEMRKGVVREVRESQQSDRPAHLSRPDHFTIPPATTSTTGTNENAGNSNSGGAGNSEKK
jgi:hypothetical protein